MVQRSSTHILRSDTMTEEVLGDLYSERALANGVTTRMADLTFASIPYKVMPEFHIRSMSGSSARMRPSTMRCARPVSCSISARTAAGCSSNICGAVRAITSMWAPAIW
jgi:cation diffusion facilitator CzcD-associated flavoprotein CzcO